MTHWKSDNKKTINEVLKYSKANINTALSKYLFSILMKK